MRNFTKINLRFLAAIFVVSGLFFAFSALAVSPSAIYVDIIPPNPAPYEETTVSLRSFAANLDIVSISWEVNGKNVLSGVGQKSFTTAVGASGSETAITARIYLPDGP